jgi:hypothetical protein
MQERDLELEHWQQQWQAQAVPPDLVHAVEKGTRSIRQGLIAEVTVSVIFGGGSTAWAVGSGRLDVAVLAIGIWTFIAIGWIASTLLRRGIWQPAATTTAAFIEVSILRCERRQQALWIQAVLYVVILSFDLIWLYYYRDETSFTEMLMHPVVVLFLAIIPPIMAATHVWYRRRLRRELQNLRSLQRELTDRAV